MSRFKPGQEKADMEGAAQRYLEHLKVELESKEEQLEELRRECVRLRREMELIETWVQTHDRLDNGVAGEGVKAEEERISADGLLPVSGKSSVLNSEGDEELRGDQLRDKIVKILEENYPQGLYYRDMLRRLKLMGYVVSGKDPGLNIIAHLSRDDRVMRGEKRGVYGLSPDYAAKIGLNEKSEKNSKESD
jgi:hypothetical protein